MAEDAAGTGAGVIPLHRPHLAQGAFAAQELVDNSAGDAEHGGECQDPADGVPPPRVHICLIVCQRLVVHHVEHKDALGGEGKVRSRGAGSWWSPAPRRVTAVAPEVHIRPTAVTRVCPQRPPGGARRLRHSRGRWHTRVPTRGGLAHHADQRCHHSPAPLHDRQGPVADHTGHVVHKAVGTCREEGVSWGTCVPRCVPLPVPPLPHHRPRQ